MPCKQCTVNVPICLLELALPHRINLTYRSWLDKLGIIDCHNFRPYIGLSHQAVLRMKSMVNHLYALEKILDKDMSYIKQTLNEDFVSVQEYDVVSREEFLQKMEEWFQEPTLDLRNANLITLTDNKDI